MVFEPPGSAKSTYASVLFPPWFIARRKNRDVIGASHGADLAEDFSGRIIKVIKEHPGELGYEMVNESVKLWKTTNGGVYRSAGAGGSITGRRADLFVIDDPIKGREDADSETIREKVWAWYRAEVITRLKPGARIVLIQCMTGDTPVLMADGRQRPLRDIRPGDAVATYDSGRLSTSHVRNWANQGPDCVYEIKTTSGTIVRANERHPFLVDRGNGPEWTRVRQLDVGDAMLRVNGESGGASPALLPSATNQQSARDSAHRTTGRCCGRAGIDRPRSTQKISETVICGTDTGLAWLNIARSFSPKTEGAPFADNSQERTYERIGVGSCALITATKPERFVGCSATTATSPLATGKPKKYCSRLLDTFEIVHDTIASVRFIGVEDVFDIEVERTENFIANGLISHNTRWHEDDLAGRLLQEMAAGADQWEILNLRAIAEDDDDPLGRALGEPLWPEWEGLDALKRKEIAVGPREWAALYQQRPAPLKGTLFKVAQIGTFETAPAGGMIARAWDLAATAQTGTRNPDWTVGAKIARLQDGRIVILDVVRLRGGPDEVEAAIVNTAKQDGYGVRIGLPQDPGQAGKTQVLYLTRKLMGYRVESSPETGDKTTRAGPFAAQVNVGNVSVVKSDVWNRALIEEMASFPASTHDDQVDALSRAFSMVGSALVMNIDPNAARQAMAGRRR